jgi:hypothetical protein
VIPSDITLIGQVTNIPKTHQSESVITVLADNTR